MSLTIGGGIVFGIVKLKPEILGIRTTIGLSSAENDRVIMEVSRLIALPTDEKPIIATVDDLDKLKENIFFERAKQGDKFLIYVANKKAILYRPSEKRIIDVATINLDQEIIRLQEETELVNTASPSATPKPTATPKDSASPNASFSPTSTPSGY